MTYKNQTYYWILPLNEGKWTLAKHIEGTWHFMDGRVRLTNDLGQTGEEIPDSGELLNKKRLYDELLDIAKLYLESLQLQHGEHSESVITTSLKDIIKRAEQK